MSISNQSTVVVTGALGHIGSALVRDIIDKCHVKKLILLDNLSTSRYASLFNLDANFEIFFVQHDLRNDINKVITCDVDYVIHLAALTEPSLSAKEPDTFIEHNIKATESVLKFCQDKAAKYIGISSTSIYGTSGNDLSEEDIFEHGLIQSPYAKCKLMEEKLVEEYINKHNIDATILRFGTIFGVSIGMRFHTAVNRFCWDASMNATISVWKTAINQSRPYLDLIDATNSIIFAMNSENTSKQIFNVVTCHKTVTDIINIIKDIKPLLEVNLVESPIMNNLSYTLSTKKIENIGFHHSGSMERAAIETLQLFNWTN